MMGIQIACTGTGGTGKGTFCKALSNELPSFQFVFSPVENIIRSKVPDSKNYLDIDRLHRIHLQNYLFNEMVKEVQRNRKICSIYERSFIDVIAYTLAFKAICKVSKGNFFYRSILSLMGEKMTRKLVKQPYDFLIYFPIAFDITKEDERANPWKLHNDLSMRILTDSYIKILLETYKIPYIDLTGIVKNEDRVNKVLQVMRGEQR